MDVPVTVTGVYAMSSIYHNHHKLLQNMFRYSEQVTLWGQKWNLWQSMWNLSIFYGRKGINYWVAITGCQVQNELLSLQHA